jgi:histone acetyltransferase (RNA polymerase elongator complex component)
LRHYNIPVFIPELACPFRCVYCNQYTITGNHKAPTAIEVDQIIRRHLTTILRQGGRAEVAFFGGSFTGLSIHQQNEYLQVVKPFIDKGEIHGIRISTRPDYITEEILSNLKTGGVTSIELGAQSLDDDVLRQSGRGHTVNTVVEASAQINNYDFELGLQMMTGLPGDTDEKAAKTAKLIISLKAATTRIYPTLVIRDTPLATLYLKGMYIPQNLEKAVDLCAELYNTFSQAGVKVLRVGLHPSESFYTGDTLLAGPFHPAFGELVQTKVWHDRLKNISPQAGSDVISIKVHPGELNAAIGHKAVNKRWLQNSFKKVLFEASQNVTKGNYHVDFY